MFRIDPHSMVPTRPKSRVMLPRGESQQKEKVFGLFQVLFINMPIRANWSYSFDYSIGTVLAGIASIFQNISKTNYMLYRYSDGSVSP